MTALAFETARPRPLAGIPIPCGWRILIAMEPVEQRTSGGIILPDAHLDQKQAVATTGWVVAVGPRAWHREDTGYEAWALPGEKVLVAKYAGQRHDLKLADGRQVELRIINDDEIQASMGEYDPDVGAPAWLTELLNAVGA